MASNRKTGTTFESELCEILSQNGFWAHNLAQNSAGQPADVIAVRNKTAYLIDCKVCSRNMVIFSVFPPSGKSSARMSTDSLTVRSGGSA